MGIETKFLPGEYCEICDTLRSLQGPCEHQVKEQAMEDTLARIQSEIGEWSRNQFGEENASKNPQFRDEELRDLPSLLGMVEEIGELVAPIVKLHQGRYKGSLDQAKEDIIDALGDLMIFMCDFAYRNDISLSDTLRMTWLKVQQRRQASWNEDKAKEPQGVPTSPHCCECGNYYPKSEFEGGEILCKKCLAKKVSDKLNKELLKSAKNQNSKTPSNIINEMDVREQTGAGFAEIPFESEETVLVEPPVYSNCRHCGGKIRKGFNHNTYNWMHIDKAENHVPVPVQDGFDTARQIVHNWVQGQDRKMAMKLINAQEKLTKGD